MRAILAGTSVSKDSFVGWATCLFSVGFYFSVFICCGHHIKQHEVKNYLKILTTFFLKFVELSNSFPLLKNRKQRYVYCTILDSIAKVTGIIKFDLHAEPQSGKKELEVGGNVEGIYELGPGRFGSEAVFVPKQPGLSGEEDDGYLIFFVHDENTGYSSPWLCTLLSLLCVLTFMGRSAP
jgi:hypothetical protein